MIKVLEIRYSGPVPGKNLKVKEWNEILRDGWFSIGRMWHRLYVPRHFTKAGAREYRYTPRKGESGSGRRFKGSYVARKIKRWGHALPLVWTGESRALAKYAVFRANKKRVKVQMPGLRKLNFRPRGGRINMVAEMQTVSDYERRKLEVELERFIDRRFREFKMDKRLRLRPAA